MPRHDAPAQRWMRDLVAAPIDAEPCITWPFSIQSDGYARVHSQRLGRTDFAYRVLWELLHGEPFPEGLHARHTCHNGAEGCVNPLHIIPGTAAENAADRDEAGRGKRIHPRKPISAARQAYIDWLAVHRPSQKVRIR